MWPVKLLNAAVVEEIISAGRKSQHRCVSSSFEFNFNKESNTVGQIFSCNAFVRVQSTLKQHVSYTLLQCSGRFWCWF